jgi:hypothetical protein
VTQKTLWLLAEAVLAACAPESAKTMDDERQQPIRLELIAEPLTLAMTDRKAFRIGLAATNRGTRTIDPQFHRTRLVIDGREAPAWNLAVGNGRREAKWFALPPGETVTLTWTSLGETLFPVPGDYVLTLRLDKTSSQTVQVRIEAGSVPP